MAEHGNIIILITECYEGIEGIIIDISGGDITIYASDDGLNANGGSGGFGGFGADGEGSTGHDNHDDGASGVGQTVHHRRLCAGQTDVGAAAGFASACQSPHGFLSSETFFRRNAMEFFIEKIYSIGTIGISWIGKSDRSHAYKQIFQT